MASYCFKVLKIRGNVFNLITTSQGTLVILGLVIGGLNALEMMFTTSIF